MVSGGGLREIVVKKVIGPSESGCVVILGDESKSFAMFVGIYEGAALIREVKGETTARPLTHELMSRILDGFGIEVKGVVINAVEDETFHAILILEQRCVDGNEEWNGKRNEVRIDCRPSDCLVIAIREKKPIFATQEVLDSVRDVALADGEADGDAGQDEGG